MDFGHLVSEIQKDNVWEWSIISDVIRESRVEIRSNSPIVVKVFRQSGAVRYGMLFCEAKFSALEAFNEAYNMGVTRKERRSWAKSVLRHEIYHMMLEHAVEISKYKDKTIAGMAMDIYINLQIGRDKFMPDKYRKQLPQFSSLFCEDIQAMGYDIKTDEGVSYYYEFLLKLKDQLKDKSDKGNASEKEQNLLDAMNETGEEDKSQSGQGEPSDKANGNPYSVASNHQWSDESGELSETDKTRLEEQIGNLIDKYEHLPGGPPGSIGGDLQEKLKKLKDKIKPVYDWKKHLQSQLKWAIRDEQRVTYSKPSRRFPKSPGTRRKRVTRILFANDVSASVSSKGLQIAYKILDNVVKAVDIDVVQCDTRITNITPYEKVRRSKDISLYGRGGTMFDPVIDYAAENRKYQYLVYFTDGEASVSTKVPKNLKIIWLVFNSPKYDTSHLPGIVVRVSEKDL